MSKSEKISIWRKKHRRICSVRDRRCRSASFEVYVRQLIGNIKRTIIKRRKHIDPNINVGYILNLLKEQRYCCALTGIILTHKIGDLRAVSIDRIDNNRGYEIGNIQLTCQLMNIGKRNKTNEECLSIIQEIRAANVNKGNVIPAHVIAGEGSNRKATAE